ncbi:hypothetical protein SAMD00019534_063240 [Acytostelium subglobosum LB1]|uniref:hypothetical protein n=1 Tax=Acytostelium subglobosum LB1 TaxID=1410327 RepID=UPI000644E6A7|nr:hypothetical protein SAMD00019534_063240 [Acytostelium subglobosum LB1]GAM23149.1 hypothetical protein SAMD00019534_063240 [Acytostelium subglobosum LB1]|eukprot:XP_012753598.1 hypothetical protein SAMD00019534_063240 [Acytostelium subglobosum LB1]
MVTTTDFFFPNVDDPYLMGKIACANVLSDLYSFGIDECDNMLMLLAASTDMSVEDRAWSTRGLIEGFNDHCKLAGTKVRGGQTVKNPWPIIGGVATSVVKNEDMIMPVNAVPGDVLVLTKPLGTQVCANFHQWIRQPEKWQKIETIATHEEARTAFAYATKSMARLNRTGARLMRKYHAHACTDVTGFGIAGHSDNLAKNQLQPVIFEIHTLPIIEGMRKIDEHLGNNWKLTSGLSAETSGGLLIAMPEAAAKELISEIEEVDKQPAWIIGRVLACEPGENKSVILPNPTIIEVKPNQNFDF